MEYLAVSTAQADPYRLPSIAIHKLVMLQNHALMLTAACMHARASNAEIQSKHDMQTTLLCWILANLPGDL